MDRSLSKDAPIALPVVLGSIPNFGSRNRDVVPFDSGFRLCAARGILVENREQVLTGFCLYPLPKIISAIQNASCRHEPIRSGATPRKGVSAASSAPHALQRFGDRRSLKLLHFGNSSWQGG
jgi:hypothetical protein